MPAKNSEKCICCCCGESLSSSNFYKSYSLLYLNGQLPICKKCFTSKFNQYKNEFQSNKIAMQRMCMAFDIYFNDDLFDTSDTNDDAVVGNYMRNLNRMQYKDKTFDNTFNEGFNLSGDRKQNGKSNNKRVAVVDEYGVEQNDEPKVEEKDIEKWGVGFQPVDYSILNAHYKYLKAANPNCDSNQEIFVNDLCYIHMQKMKALQNGEVDAYSKLTESYRKSFKQAGLKTVDDVKTDNDCWSMWTYQVAQYTPEELYKNKERYKDHDGLGEYFERMAVRPIKNIVFGTQDRDQEFYVHEED